jgi:hypothetical protein
MTPKFSGFATVSFVCAALACLEGSEWSRSGGARNQVLRIERGDTVTSGQLAELRRRSPTGGDLLDRIERLQSTVLIIRAYPLLVKTTGLDGPATSASSWTGQT